MKNAVNWFEIPVKDFNIAKKFYETVLKIEMHVCPERQWGFFPFDMPNGGIGGTIVKNSKYEPSKTGSLIYLNGGDNRLRPPAAIAFGDGRGRSRDDWISIEFFRRVFEAFKGVF